MVQANTTYNAWSMYAVRGENCWPMTATPNYCKSKSLTAPQLVCNRSAVTDAAAWHELMSMIHHCHCRLDKSSAIKTDLCEGYATYNASFSWQKQYSCTCDVCTQIDSVVCCSLVQTANAETLGRGDVLVTLCVTCVHMMYVAAWSNLSPHTASVYAVQKAASKKINQTQNTSSIEFHHESAEVSVANIA